MKERIQKTNKGEKNLNNIFSGFYGNCWNIMKIFFYKWGRIHWDRMTFLTAVYIMFSLMIIWRLFGLQVLDYDYYKAIAQDRDIMRMQKNDIQRGNIFVEDFSEKGKLYPLGIDKEYSLIYAVPAQVKKPLIASGALADVLGLDKDSLELHLSKKEDPYEPLAHKVDKNTLQAVKNLGIKGIHYSSEKWRYYPSASSFAHVIGFVGYDEDKKKGLYGVEGFFEDELSGLKSDKNVFSGHKWSLFSSKMSQNKKKGSDIVLTLDRSVQFVACSKLEEYVKRFNAKSGNVIIMNPKTGAIIAMCNYPDFDSNEYSKVSDVNVYNNAAIFSAYEPGSTFKTITMSAALDANVVDLNTTFLDEGYVKIGKYTIKNYASHVYGVQNMTQILEKSINTGAIFVSDKLGFESFKSYLFDFGFGRKTGIDLDYEGRGDLSSLDRKSDIYLATASYGQGITVTPIQMVAAYAVIANQGRLMRPYTVKRVIKPNGQRLDTKPKFIRQVISPRSAAVVGGMLVSVVNNGHGAKAAVDGYYVGGKTGTAQLHQKNGVGYSDQTIQSFIGFAPVDNPLFVMITKIDEPTDSPVAAVSAAPLFAEIAKYVLEYYQIPRDY